MNKKLRYLLLGLGLGGSFALGSFLSAPVSQPIGHAMVEAAAELLGLTFTEPERDSMLTNLTNNRDSYARLRQVPLPNDVVPALQFNPLPEGFTFEREKKPLQPSTLGKVPLPKNRDELAYYTVAELGQLIKTRQISSVELTTFFLDRLKKYDAQLHCVITLTDDLALAQARRADAELAAGTYRGPLHGIPYGAKDLLAKKGYKTTWGAKSYQDQTLDLDATVIQRLEAAGAVLCAKLSLGALAWGDVWFGGLTRNPWAPDKGSSGSSAGSASAVAAGLLPFAIGSETLGPIVSPSTICGTTGLRPTYGRVSRHGAMALSWSMDKLGPICRAVEDCALVFDAIYGPDGKDATVLEVPFNYAPLASLKGVRLGYLQKAFDSNYPNRAHDQATLEVLRKLGATLVPLELPDYPVGDMTLILSAEAAAAFDDLTRSNRDDELTRQIKNAWPNVFRASRFIPAVEYIQANRLRTQLIQDFYQVLKQADVEVYLSPTYGNSNLAATNLTGHPCVVLPNGFSPQGTPTSITFMGQLFQENQVLAVAKAYQDATDHHRKHPKLP
ncbi:amidase [Rhabdobacter roseus]|uniref:Asp-tRNA(Asn)/Glu-tRNA(Gln) amidotransferase A subunit family amidase n=1 Tax=Rhabdobacter roseus TaxID=1655419 RepID=A0A840U6S3_9BACT|nr:amidase [Rhabdobacter roseus]MBB5287519.1 Asp-tRNA(Asn)/Glu-tRNA(Gln) amidotransferase A subunit family amidase [Rhabdobacter roseus]